MTILELYNFLGQFIKEHPKCKTQNVMVKRLDDDHTWEEVTFVSNCVNERCPEYGSPLYLHSKTQEKVEQKYIEKMQELEEQEDEYYF